MIHHVVIPTRESTSTMKSPNATSQEIGTSEVQQDTSRSVSNIDQVSQTDANANRVELAAGNSGGLEPATTTDNSQPYTRYSRPHYHNDHHRSPISSQYVRSSDTLPHPQENAYEARNYIQPSSHIAVPHQGQFGNQVHNQQHHVEPYVNTSTAPSFSYTNPSLQPTQQTSWVSYANSNIT